MSTVGIIVNPASGKDIRRVIAAGTVVTNQEKINIVLRLLQACDTVGDRPCADHARPHPHCAAGDE